MTPYTLFGKVDLVMVWETAQKYPYLVYIHVARYIQLWLWPLKCKNVIIVYVEALH